MPSVLVTGANGQLGRRLIAALPAAWTVVALVRSERARRMLRQHVAERPGLTVALDDPCDADALAQLAADCAAAVHLIGTIKETRANRYADSHQRPARALAAAAGHAGLAQIVYLSILGADPSSPSRCLRARAAVEDILLRAATPATVIRVPMVLGEEDRASRALARRAMARHVVLFRAASLEQPIYAGDVILAVMNALGSTPAANRVFDLAGPESLSRRALVTRAAAIVARRPSIHSVPLALGLAIAAVAQRLSGTPQLTAELLRVLDHDDAIDPAPAAAALGVTLTPLDIVLERCLQSPVAQRV